MIHRKWILAAPLAALMCGAVGCSGSPDGEMPGEAVGQTSQAIYGGASDNDTDANESVVAIKITDGSEAELCTGALIAPNVVLTAHHCVSAKASTAVACDQNGKSGNGAHLGDDYGASQLQVFIGPSPNLRAGGVAVAKQIFRPNTNLVCNSDIAILVLDHAIGGVKPLPVRLDNPTRRGEMLTSVGYGENNKGQALGTRYRRSDVSILSVGSTVTPQMIPLGSEEFEVGQSICQGDSGGPAISAVSGAVIGVVSRGAGCNESYGHIYTRTQGFRALFEQAFAAAGATLIEEPKDMWSQPDGTIPASKSATFGESCQDNSFCSSNMCVAQDKAQFCSHECAQESDCPSGYACMAIDGSRRACASADGSPIISSVEIVPTSTRAGSFSDKPTIPSCAASPTGLSNSSPSLAAWIVGALALVAGARRRGQR